MLFRSILPFSLTLILGILIGRISSTSHDERSTADEKQSRRVHGNSGLHHDEPTANRERARSRPVLAKKDSKEDTVEVPLQAAKSALSGNFFLLMDFSNSNERIDTALSLLGATRDQRRQASELMDDTRERILEAEQKNFKVREKDEHKVELDLGEIGKASTKIIEETQQRFREILPEETADIFLKAMRWSAYYPPMKANSNSATLSISGHDSVIIANISNGGNSHGTLIENPRYSPRSTAIPAAEVFEERWKPYLKDIYLTPTAGE